MHTLLVRQALQPFLPSKRRFLQAFAPEFLCNTARGGGPYDSLGGEARENDDPSRVTSAAGCADGGNVRGEEPSVVRLMEQMVPHQRNTAPGRPAGIFGKTARTWTERPQPEDRLSSGWGFRIRRSSREGALSRLWAKNAETVPLHGLPQGAFSLLCRKRVPAAAPNPRENHKDRVREIRKYYKIVFRQ